MTKSSSVPLCHYGELLWIHTLKEKHNEIKAQAPPKSLRSNYLIWYHSFTDVNNQNLSSILLSLNETPKDTPLPRQTPVDDQVAAHSSLSDQS
jgi:hypothetical protein